MASTFSELLPSQEDAFDTPSRQQTLRVLHLINGEHYSGAERVQDLLALRLPEFGFDVAFGCLKLGRFGGCRQSQSTLYDFSMKSRLDLGPARRIARLVKHFDYRLIHTHTPRAALVGLLAARFAGVPLVHHLHSPTLVDSTHRFRNRVNVVIEQLGLARAAAVIAVSQSLGEYARRQHVDPNRIHVVPNGVPIQGRLISRKVPSGTWTLGTVALFRPRKGLEVLLETLAILRSQGFPVRLRAVGAFETEDYERQIHEQVERLQLRELIDWTGFTRDVQTELGKMDLFVLPSVFGEGLPMVVLEAMAAGVPVVATRVEGIPEAIRDCIDGLIATPQDPKNLAIQIERLIRGKADWNALRVSAHRRQEEKFSDLSMAQGVAQVYQTVLEQ